LSFSRSRLNRPGREDGASSLVVESLLDLNPNIAGAITLAWYKVSGRFYQL